MKKIVIICKLDGFANSIKPLEIQKYLEKRGHNVILLNTLFIHRLVIQNNILKTRSFPQLSINIILLHIIQILSKLFSYKFNQLFPIYYYLLSWEMTLRAQLLFKLIKTLSPDFLIGESQIDSHIFLKKLKCKTLYDCATPWADELYFGKYLLKKQYYDFLKMELRVYNSVSYLSFHWEAYNHYIKKYYYRGNNLITLNGGCTVKSENARYASPLRIVYIGYLGGYWIDLKLLSRLTKIYPYIDIYGYPPPDSTFNLNYKGYAKPEVLKNYQFGLITITKDRLRKEGFSAKHLEYLSYGLPVLVPEWRESSFQFKGTIKYNESNFLDIISKYSKKTCWNLIHQECLKQAKEFSWDNVLKPLDSIISE